MDVKQNVIPKRFEMEKHYFSNHEYWHELFCVPCSCLVLLLKYLLIFLCRLSFTISPANSPFELFQQVFEAQKSFQNFNERARVEVKQNIDMKGRNLVFSRKRWNMNCTTGERQLFRQKFKLSVYPSLLN